MCTFTKGTMENMKVVELQKLIDGTPLNSLGINLKLILEILFVSLCAERLYGLSKLLNKGQCRKQKVVYPHHFWTNFNKILAT